MQPVFIVRKQIAVSRKLMEVNLHTAKLTSDAAPRSAWARQQWEDFCYKLYGHDQPMSTYSQQRRSNARGGGNKRQLLLLLFPGASFNVFWILRTQMEILLAQMEVLKKKCATLTMLNLLFKSFFLFFSVLLECYIVINLLCYQICSLKSPDHLILDSWFKSYEV